MSDDVLTSKLDPGVLARLMHVWYEDLAPLYGYETRGDTRRAFENLTEGHRQLMTEVARRSILAVMGAPEAGNERLERCERLIYLMAEMVTVVAAATTWSLDLQQRGELGRMVRSIMDEIEEATAAVKRFHEVVPGEGGDSDRQRVSDRASQDRGCGVVLPADLSRGRMRGDPERDQRVVDLRLKGASLRAIADEVGLSAEGVRRVLTRLGVSGRLRGRGKGGC